MKPYQLAKTIRLTRKHKRDVEELFSLDVRPHVIAMFMGYDYRYHSVGIDIAGGGGHFFDPEWKALYDNGFIYYNKRVSYQATKKLRDLADLIGFWHGRVICREDAHYIVTPFGEELAPYDETTDQHIGEKTGYSDKRIRFLEGPLPEWLWEG